MWVPIIFPALECLHEGGFGNGLGKARQEGKSKRVLSAEFVLQLPNVIRKQN